MANNKLTFKTPLGKLSWLNVRGQGKLKMDKDPSSTDPRDYAYTATVTLTKEQADTITKKLTKFWMDNKPSGVGKQKYPLVKEEFVKVMGPDGKPKLDDEGDAIKEATGMYTMQAKTLTQWPDGKPVMVKLMGSNGQSLIDGHPLEAGCGNGTEGILHGSIAIYSNSGNHGLSFYLQGVQIKDSSFKEYTGGDEMEIDSIEDDVAETSVEATGEMPAV